jgi:transposase-like protein
MTTTSKKRRVFTALQRQDYVERFGRSGLSQAKFCRRVKIPAGTFSLWRRRAEVPRTAFATVETSAPVAAPHDTIAVILHLANGTRLEVPIGSEATWRGLATLLNSLQT